jgi:5-hydroxyisourate hydrolase-like protein (transthyretin family)
VLTVSNLAVGKYTLRVTTTPDADHNAVDSDLSVTVNRARASIKATKTTVALKKSGKFSVTLVDSKTGKGIANMKVTLKVYTGKKCKTVTLRTNSKGVANYQTKKLAKGSHKVIISAKHSGYDFYPVTTSIKVVKQKAIKFKVNRKTAKDGASLSITVLDKKTKKHLNGVKVKLLIYSGSKLVRTEILKTLTKYGKKGIVGYATNELSVGNHKVKIVAGDIRYSGSSKSGLKILKSAKAYPKVTTRVSAKL